MRSRKSDPMSIAAAPQCLIYLPTLLYQSNGTQFPSHGMGWPGRRYIHLPSESQHRVRIEPRPPGWQSRPLTYYAYFRESPFLKFSKALTFAKKAKIRENRENFCSRKFVHLKYEKCLQQRESDPGALLTRRTRHPLHHESTC